MRFFQSTFDKMGKGRAENLKIKTPSIACIIIAVFLTSFIVLPQATARNTSNPARATLISPNPIGATSGMDPYPGGRFGYAVTADGGYIFVSEATSYAIHVYDFVTREYVKSFEGASVATGCGYVAISNPGFNEVEIYDLSDLDTLVSTLTSPDPYKQNFGQSIALNGNLLVISDAGNALNNPVAWSGDVYVYSIPDFSLLGTLNSPSPVYCPWAPYGWSIAVFDNYIVIGEPYATVDGVIGAGKVYVYDYDDDAITFDLVATISNPYPTSSWGNFGWSLAEVSGQILVGAPFSPYTDNKTGTLVEGAGAVYMYSTDGSLNGILNSKNPSTYGQFGSAIATDDSSVIVGAFMETKKIRAAAIEGVGNAYVFTASGEYVKPLSSLNPQEGGAFGYSVTLFNGSYLVGAPYEDVAVESIPFVDAGQVYILK